MNMPFAVDRVWSVSRAALVAAIVAGPSVAGAQGDAYGAVWISTVQVYEDNLFAASASQHPQNDFVSTFGPTFEAGYASTPWVVAATYAVDAERYADHVELNRLFARQEGTLDARYLPTSRLTLEARAAHVETQTPNEFNVNSLLAAGRAQAQRTLARSTVTYAWTALTDLHVDYDFSRDRIAGAETVASDGRMTLVRRVGPRNAYRVAGGIRDVRFPLDAGEVSGVVTLGWARQVGRQTRFEIDLGPRVTERATRPEVSAVLEQRWKPGDLSLSYSRTQVTAVGQLESIDMHRLILGSTYRPVSAVTLVGITSLARASVQDRSHVAVYAVELKASLQATRRVSLVASARIGRQDGAVDRPTEAISSGALTLGLIVKALGGALSGQRPPASSTTRR